MKKAAEANNVELSKELESLRAKFSNLQVNNNQLSQQVASLQAQVTGEERIKAAFEEFKKYEDDRVSSQCAEMDARLDALSIDFDEELYPHMLTMIAGGLLGTQGEVELDLANIEAYDPEAKDKFMATMQWIRDLRSSSSQLKIPVYPEVRDPKYPWAVKEEMLLEDAIAANKSRAEKKRKCQIVCRTHGVGSAHHARSDGVPMFAPTVIPQGLQILLKDATAQTEPPEDRSSPRLVRSKSLPAMYNLDWP
ncbi:hypothetical protein Tco_1553496 [Tanacetum coccineum]